MTRYILDTDHLTLLQQFHPNIVQRIDQSRDDDRIMITVVTVEEQIQGWLSSIRKYSQSGQPDKLMWADQGLRNIVKYMSQFDILDFNREAYNCFQQLSQQKIRIGTQDLRRAAIALSENCILVTRNKRDFNQVPNLR